MRFVWILIAGGVVPLLLAVTGARGAISSPALAQAPVIRSWGTEAGLPQNTVSAVVQTRDGYLWLGTQDGLARFDGVRFKTFSLKDGLPNLVISALHEDREGSLWIGTSGSGLCRLKQGRIETIPSSENRPGSDTINCITENAGGQLWVGTAGGLRFCREGKLVEDSAFANLGHAPISCICRSQGGQTMWIASFRHGLFSYRDGKLEPCIGPAGIEKVAAECLFEDREGSLWVGIGNGRLLRRENGNWRIFNQTDGLPFAYITSITEDADGTIWAGSLDAGLYRFDGARFNQVSKKDGLSADDIRSLYCDREGNLWVGTRIGGLDRLTRRKLVVVSDAQGLTNDFTHSVAQTPDGALWVGTTGGSLYRGDASGFHRFLPKAQEVSFYAFDYAVLTAPDGSLWWGAQNALLHWKDNQLADCITNEPWVLHASITALQNDGRGGMWIGTGAGHLVHLEDGRFFEYPQRFTRAAISSLAVEPNGGLWVGTMASGLKFIPSTNNSLLSITNGLQANSSIRALYLDRNGTLWIGTAGAGLCCLRNGKVTSFSASQGLPPSTVLQIVEDDHNSLWLGTRRGIFRASKGELLDCADGKILSIHSRSFGINDGMLTEECSGGTCPNALKTQSGLICMPTVKGLVFLKPDELHDETPPPTVLLEGAFVSGAEQKFVADRGSDQNPLSGQPLQPGLVVAPGKREIELHYTAIGNSAPEKIGFRYKLTPLDNNWTEAASQRTIKYPHLPPGDFTFHVQACNANGQWNEQDTTLALTVLPFFWETAWFYALAIAAFSGLFAAGIWLVLRRRYKLRLAHLEMLHAIERERLRISKDMHDQVGGVLTQVSQLSDLGLNETEDEVLVKKRLERIGDRARVAVQALDEMVWAINPKNDNLASFAEYVSRFSDEFFEFTNIRCWQEVPPTLPALPLRAEVRHNVFLAVREALNNALKHSQCEGVWLKIKIDDGVVTLKIEDNGEGFVATQTTPGGNGLGNMEARLVECGGRLELASTPGKGTSVSFIFPVKW